MRMARSDTGTSAGEWLKTPVSELPEWVEIVSDENKILKAEMEKLIQKSRR